MKRIKRVSLVALLLAFMMSLTACSGTDAIKFKKAMDKQQEIKSAETDMSIGLSVKGEGLDEEVQELVDLISGELEKVALNVKTKSIAEENIKAKTQVDVNVKYEEKDMDISVWQDVDLSEDGKILQVIRMPEEMMAGLPTDKEYIVYDYDNLIKYQSEELGMEGMANFDLKGITDWALNVSDKLETSMNDIGKKINLDNIKLEDKGLKNVDGQWLEVMELRLSDKDLKDLTREVVNESLDNEDFREIVVEYIDLIKDAAGIPEEDLEGLLEKDIEASIPEVKEKFNEIMDKVDSIPLISEEGIVIEYGINTDGFIASEKVKFDLVIDLEKINTLMNTEGNGFDLKLKGKILVGIELDALVTKINDDKISVDFPETNEENSIDYVELMKKQALEMEKLMEELEETDYMETIEE